jgi:hypothetical protein
MLQDLSALAPPLIVCVAFLVGVGVLVRRELAPKRRARAQDANAGPANDAEKTHRTVVAEHAETVRMRGEGSET